MKSLPFAVIPTVLLASLTSFAQEAPAPAADSPAAVEAPAAGEEAPAEEAKAEVEASSEGEEGAAESPAEEAELEVEVEAEIVEPEVDVVAEAEVEAEEVPEEVAAEPGSNEAATVGYDIGYRKGFFLQSADGRFKLMIGGRVQGRFTRWSHDPRDGSDAEYRYQFSISRARIHFKGHAYSKDLTYKFQADFGKGTVRLKDYFVNYKFLEDIQLLVGQGKRPFSRQQLTSSGNQQFVDRAITDKAFGSGRDLGIMLHNNVVKKKGVEYALGIYNGTGAVGRFSGSGTADLTTGDVSVESGRFSNVPAKMEPTLVGRVGYNDGIKGYSESDLEGGDFRYGVGASGLADMNLNESGDSKMRFEVDAIVKAQGWSFTGAFYISSEQYDENYFGDRRQEALGAHIQGGYVIDNFIEPALRWATVTREGATNAEEVTTNAYTAGLNLFFYGHKVKWANDFTVLLNDPAEGNTSTGTELRSQLQFSF